MRSFVGMRGCHERVSEEKQIDVEKTLNHLSPCNERVWCK